MQIDKAIEGLKQLATCNPAGFVAHTSLFYSADLSASGFHVSIFKWSSGPPARYHVYCTVVGSPGSPKSVSCESDDLARVILAGCYTEAGWYAVTHDWPQEDVNKLIEVRKELNIEVTNERHVIPRFSERHPLAVPGSGSRSPVLC